MRLIRLGESSPNTDALVLVHGRLCRLEPSTGTLRAMRNCWRVILVVLLALSFVWVGEGRLCVAGHCSAELTSGSSWEPAGFGGAGNFLSVHFDPKMPGVVYSASDVAGVFRSVDYGDHWEMRSVGLGNYEVSSLAVDPNANVIYAGTGAFSSSNKGGIYVSHDAGLSWQQLPSTFANRISFRRFRTADAIALDPTREGVILSGSRDNGIWRSTDGGQSWSQVYAAPLTSAPLLPFPEADDPTADPHAAPVSVIVFDPSDQGTAYAGLDGVGVIKSTADGVAGSWREVNDGLPSSATVKYLAIGNDGVLYVAVGTAGVYRSSNGGKTWQRISDSLPTLDDNTWVSSVAVDPKDSNVAYVTLATYDYPNVWKTTDGGATWLPKGKVAYDPVYDPTEVWAVNPTLSWQVAVDSTNPERLFYVSYWDIYRSVDGGESWATKIVGAQNTVVTDIVVDSDHLPGQPDVIYAAHMDAGLLSSTSEGAAWTAFPRTYDPAFSGHYWSLAIAKMSDVKYYYVTSDPWEKSYGQVLRSTDGVNWITVFKHARPKGQFMDGAMLGLAVDPTQQSTVYVTQNGGQVWKSTNNGENWAPTTGQPHGSSFTYALAVDLEHRIFVGTLNEGLWRSEDGGASWTRVLSGQGTIFRLLAVPGAVYVSCGDSNLYRSTDGGDSWKQLTNFSSVNDGDGVGDLGVAIAVDPNDPDHILFGTVDAWHPADAGSGVVESTNGGDSWSSLNAGLGQLNVNALAILKDGAMFAGTTGGGIWRFGPGSMSVTTTAPSTQTITRTQLSSTETTQLLTSILTTTVTRYTSTQTSISTIHTTIALVPSTVTSTVQSTQYHTSILTTTVTSYTSTSTLTSTIPTVTTVVLVPSTATSTVQSTQYLTSTTTTTTTSYTSTTTSTSTSVVYTTVTTTPGGAAASSSPFAYLGFVSLLAVAVGGRITVSEGRRVPKFRSLMRRRCLKT
jgi:xyloglucan-specific exo-beta-1,4-glucanase